MARKKAARRRRKPSFKILNALESLTYLEIIMRGTTGTGTMGFLTGEGDLGYSKSTLATDSWGGSSMSGAHLEGTDEISLSDLVSQPSLATNQILNNLQTNLLPMALAGITTSVTFSVSKRLLRKPINSINRTIMRPLLGSGISL